MRKQLSVNHDKCKYMIMGPKKFREDTLAEIRDKLAVDKENALVF